MGEGELPVGEGELLSQASLSSDLTESSFFFFLIKCKKYIISKRARQACNTSWEPAENQKMHKRTIRERHPQRNRS